MNKFFNKHIFIILGIVVMWLGIIPFFFARAIPVICENITYNTKYNVEIEKPRLVLNVLPTAIIKADSLKIIKKDSKDFLFADNPKIKIRLLPLISGTLHINKFSASNIEVYKKLPDNPVLDKDFFKNLENANIKFDALGLKRFSVKLNQSNVPIVYEGNTCPLYITL